MITLRRIAAVAVLLASATMVGCAAPSARPVTATVIGDVPGTIARAAQEEILTDEVDAAGMEHIVARTTRTAGTRTPLHQHDHGGTTCILSGEMTLYMDGHEPHRAIAGECYYMPTGMTMAGYASGQADAVMLDIFDVPEGADVWRVVEDAGAVVQDQFTQTAD